MKNRFHFSRGNIIAFICCSILPGIAAGVVPLMMFHHVITTPRFLLAHWLLPLVAEVALGWCIFTYQEAREKIASCIAILLVFVLAFCFAAGTTTYTYSTYTQGAEAEQAYLSVKGEHEVLPELSELGQPIALQHYHLNSHILFFLSEADHLICRYTPEEYELQKARLNENYIFQSEAITTNSSHCEPAAEVDGYHFRLLSTEEYKQTLDFPEQLILIGCSDEAREIVYLVYDSMDLDSISSLHNFISDDCSWKYIR